MEAAACQSGSRQGSESLRGVALPPRTPLGWLKGTGSVPQLPRLPDSAREGWPTSPTVCSARLRQQHLCHKVKLERVKVMVRI